MATPDSKIHRGLLSVAAYAGMFVFGIVMALLGTILPVLSARLEFQASSIGTLFLVMNFAMLASSLLLGVAMDRFGMKPPLAAGPLLVAASLVMILRADTFAALIPTAVLLGVGGGALNGATNTLVADLHDEPKRKSSALNVLGVFFGFGALFLPFTIGALLVALGLEYLLLFAALLCIAAGVFSAVLRFAPPKQRQQVPFAAMPRFIRSPLVLFAAALLFFQSGVEFTLGGYIATYLTNAMGLAVSSASFVLAGYWAALMVSRIALSRMLLGGDPHRFVALCALSACAGAVLTVVASSPALAAAAIVFTGLALAGIYPTVLGITGAEFREHSGTVFGLLFTVALTGGMTLPWVAGKAAQAAGLRWVFVIVAVSFGAIFVLGRLIARPAQIRRRLLTDEQI
ncbi:MAG: MFS transporter [Bryobacterales bacterium]|nr:MFS transporter [Bryobacterales bacterium]